MAENFGDLPRNPSLKRSWIDCNVLGTSDEGSNGVEIFDEHGPGVKRSRDSSTDLQGDKGYVSNLSESHSDQQELTGDAENSCGTDSQEQDEGLWFCTKKPTSSPVDDMTEKEPHSEEVNGVHLAVTPTQVTEEHNTDTEDSLSEASGLSDSLSTEGWQPMAGAMSWLHLQMLSGANPRDVLSKLIPGDADIPDDIDDLSLWKAVLQMLTNRKKLPEVNTIDDVVCLMKQCKNIIVLTGAGVSVSCGIPDFRSRDGVYARLAVDYPDLPDPQAMFDIHYFRRNPNPFFTFAKEMYPGQFEPSVSHKFIQLIEQHNKLLRNYTQNIDTLEQVAGIKRVLQCHGSFATATCMMCGHHVDAEDIKQEVMNQTIPRCPICPSHEEHAILKPDIVFFGESLPESFHRQMELDRSECDLLIVIGSSLKVRPVALIPNDLPPHVPQVLINREPLKHLNFDVELLGDCDVIVNELCHRLGESWSSACTTLQPCRQVTRDDLLSSSSSPSSTPSTSSSPGITAPLGSTMDLPHVDSCGSLAMTFKLESTHIDSQHQPSDMENNTDEQTQDSSEEKLPTQESMHTSMDSAPPYQDSAPPCQDSAPPCQDSAPPCEDSAPPCQDSVSPHQDSAHQIEDRVHLSQDRASSPSQEAATSSDAQQTLEDMKSAWQPRLTNMAAKLQDDTYMFVSPNRYIFKGAEVYTDSDTDLDSSSSLDSTTSDAGEATTDMSSPHDGVQLESSGQRHFAVFSEPNPGSLSPCPLGFQSPSRDVVLQSPARDFFQSPSRDLFQSPGRDLFQSPSHDVYPSPTRYACDRLDLADVLTSVEDCVALKSPDVMKEVSLSAITPSLSPDHP